MSLLSPLAPYLSWIKLGLFVAVCAAAYVYGGSNAKARAERECLRREAAELRQAIAERDQAIEQRDAARAKADKLAALPPKVIERVRENPSGCTLPRPVADGLREQVRATNDAIRAVP